MYPFCVLLQFDSTRYGKENAISGIPSTSAARATIHKGLDDGINIHRIPTSVADTSLDTTTSSDRRMIKRKVVRFVQYVSYNIHISSKIHVMNIFCLSITFSEPTYNHSITITVFISISEDGMDNQFMRSQSWTVKVVGLYFYFIGLIFIRDLNGYLHIHT